MGTVFSSLQVTPGFITLAGKSIPFWGYTYAYHPRPRPQLPGPIIQATAGDFLRITLVVRPNAPFAEDLSIIFPGQEGVEVRHVPAPKFRPVQPQYANGKMVSLTDYLTAGEIGAIEYRFRALRPGVYLYESGTNSAKQVQMGLYGVIVVRPVGYHQPGHPNFRTAYGQNTTSRHDIEKILVLGEIDSAMHKSVVPGAEYNLLDFCPDHWVINGRTFPASIAPDDDSSQPYGSAIRCRLGQRVLLRILNAGFQAHTLALGALTGRVIAEDAYPLKIGSSDATYEKTAVTVGPGQSLDLVRVKRRRPPLWPALFSISSQVPGTIIDKTISGKYYLYAKYFWRRSVRWCGLHPRRGLQVGKQPRLPGVDRTAAGRRADDRHYRPEPA